MSIKTTIKKVINLIKSDGGDVAKNVQCTEFEVDNWKTSEFIIKKLIPISGTHPYPIAELNLMVAAICRLKPQQIFEWGTNIGKSARIFYEIGKQFDIKFEIYSIDLPDDLDHQEHPRSTRGQMVKGLAGITLHQGDGLSKAIELFQHHSGKSTLVFIDGDHSYESVYRELNGVIVAMPQAHILLHDTFYQSSEAGYNIGPHKAVVETMAKIPGKYRVMSAATGLPGMTLLYTL